MAVQKRRRSKGRTSQQRAIWMQKHSTSSQAVCPRPGCGEPKLPHRVCPACGWYKDREVVVKETADTTTTEGEA